MAKAQNIQAVLVAIPEFNALKAAMGNLDDHPMYEKIAEETATPLIKDVFSEVLSDRSLKADQIHPNKQGYALVAEKMLNSLKDLGLKSK